MIPDTATNPNCKVHLTESVLSHGIMDSSISIGQDGRIRLPGIPSGLSIPSYFPIVHLYTSILEANRILDRYRSQLTLVSRYDNFQAPLTALDPSNLMPNLYYKREDQTVTRAYKVRGAVVGMAKVMESQDCHRFLAVSTGNHALGVLKAAELLRPLSVRIVVPRNTAANKLHKISSKIEFLGELGVDAGMAYQGETFDEARAWAMAQNEGEYYLDPYSDPWVVAGQGTIGMELFNQLMSLLNKSSNSVEEVVVIAPIGGGGLLAGTATALKMAATWEPKFRSVNVQLVGLKLASLETLYGDAIRVQQIASGNRMLFDLLGVSIMEIDDTHMKYGIAAVKKDLGAEVEGASAATIYPVHHFNAYKPSKKRLVISLLSGGNVG